MALNVDATTRPRTALARIENNCAHDLDGDRWLGLLVATRDMLVVGLNPGDGHFDAEAFYNVSQLSGPLAVADLDLDHDLAIAIAGPGGITAGVMDVVDGWPDIAIGDSISGEFRVLLNRDDNVFETWPWDTYEVVDNFRNMVAADANEDGLSVGRSQTTGDYV